MGQHHHPSEMPAAVERAINWRILPGLSDYLGTVAAMEQQVDAIIAGQSPEQIWLLEHPSIYTAGTSARMEDLLAGDRFPVYRTGRGGQFTYHGPGQRIAYMMLDLKRRSAGRGADVRAFVCNIERWIIATLAEFGVCGETRPGRIGVWVSHDTDGTLREDKIAALGIRVRRGIAFHGLSLNVAPDLEHFTGIVPCGIADHGVTSLKALGMEVTGADVDAALQRTFAGAFDR